MALARVPPFSCFGRESITDLNHHCQFERICTVLSEWPVAFVGRCSRKSCSPPIPSCIIIGKTTVVCSPGFSVRWPTFGCDGQQPFTTSRYGALVKTSG